MGIGGGSLFIVSLLMASSGGIVKEYKIMRESDPPIRPSWPFGLEVAAEFTYRGIVPLAA